MAEATEQEKLLNTIKEQNEAQIKEFKTEFTDLMDDSKKGLLTEDQFNTKFKAISEKLEGFDPVAYKKFEETLKGYEDKLKTMGSDMAKLEEGGINFKNNNPLEAEIKAAVESDSFKEFEKTNGAKKASFTLKAVSVTGDYTGNSRVHITTRDSRVVDYPEVTRLNIRDLLVVQPADLPYLAFTEVYDWDRNEDVIDENGVLAESTFKVREATVDVKRIGTHIPLSKRMLKSSTFVTSHIMQRMPAMVRYQEDFQLLHGDGLGENVLGIFNKSDDFTTIINTAVVGSAGAVASVASYNGGDQALITFSANQNIGNGDTITIASATASIYNNPYSAIVKSPKQIVIDVAYVAEADTSAWTFNVNNPFKDSIASAQEIDVLKVANTLVSIKEYRSTGIVMNPTDATKIETLKGNDEHYLDVQRLENGVLTIGGVPVVETTAMPAGKFIVGDWLMAAALFQFTELTLEFSESTQEKLKNMVEAIIQEEILFPIYNQHMFVSGDFATATTAIAQ